MNKIALKILFGILSILIGIVSIPLLFVYSMTQSPDLDILYYFFVALIIFGLGLLISIRVKPKK